MLTEDEFTRYHRQIIFPDFGAEGQERLKKAHTLIAGVGGLGSPAAIYLASAGVGKITIVDSDPVELSNLNRQILHWEEDVGQQKVLSAEKKLQRMNSTGNIVPLAKRLDMKNAGELLDGVSIAVDCLDNFETRFILNQACIQNDVPLIHGGINGLKGEITTIIPGQT
ncbi:MAG: HesA/MoeB/ThiF family protein, partial [Deltaproteobacteria bacterium]|nr:HesA/MoeB/ThiF family protein [Deltaproteobacteria bacterium]